MSVADVSGVVERRVRDAVRDRGIDPLREPAVVRAIVDEALAGLAADWAGGSGEVVDPADVARQAFDAVAGFGPLQRLLDDPRVEEVWINAPDRVFCARDGVSELTSIVLDARQVRDLVERMLRVSGRRLDLSSPFVDAMLPDGSRLHVVIPDVTREHWTVNVRRFVVRARSIGELASLGAITVPAAAFLDAAVVSGLNIVVAGGTQAGKTTVLNALLGCVPTHERIVSCEEVFEVRLDHADAVSLQTRDAGVEGRGAITLRRLVREALRMRPTRLVVGEVRGEESMDLSKCIEANSRCRLAVEDGNARQRRRSRRRCEYEQSLRSGRRNPRWDAPVRNVIQSAASAARLCWPVAGGHGAAECATVMRVPLMRTGCGFFRNHRRTGVPPWCVRSP